jgi:hypothetical protein
LPELWYNERVRLMEENILTASERVIRNIRIDDARHGGLLSLQTIQATEELSKQVDKVKAKSKPNADART